MLIKVFNRETASVEAIDSADLKKGVHLHRNSHREFWADEIKAFWGKETKSK